MSMAANDPKAAVSISTSSGSVPNDRAATAAQAEHRDEVPASRREPSEARIGHG